MVDLSGQSLGRYHLLEKLGEGGMASVYKAFDARLEREVAVKVIRRDAFSAEVTDRILQRFEREAKVLSKLTHANIVPIIDYGDEGGSPWLVMPFIPGGTLKKRLDQGRIGYQEAARLLVPIARALAFAHAKGILHRDVKPSNILITEDGDPLLSDFGVAKILEDTEGATLTGTGAGLGTPEYMAPEQWLGKASPASDQYSLGIVFYEMVTGRKPFTADTPAAVLLKQASESLPRPRNFTPGLPDEVEKVLLKVLARKPEDRYGNLLEFTATLERLQKKTPQTKILSKPAIKSESVSPLDRSDTVDQFKTRGEVDSTTPQNKPMEINDWPPLNDMKSGKNKPHTAIFIALVFVLLGLTLLVVWRTGGFKLSLATKQIETSVQSANVEKTPAVIETLLNPTVTIHSTPALHIGSTLVSLKDGMAMVYVPAGSFIMGTYMGESDEQPPHEVFLDAYWIDKTEVTNAMYKKCVDSGSCTPPSSTSNYNNSQYQDHPVIFVNWNQAKAYCAWAGRQLPSEAQWEKAARGTNRRTYPWGNDSPTCSLVNYSNCKGDTTSVGIYTSGRSVYEAYDMAGNVWEWVADWYGPYPSEIVNNPQGPSSGDYKVHRGGSWEYDSFIIRTTNREVEISTNPSSRVGFRCSLPLQ